MTQVNDIFEVRHGATRKPHGKFAALKRAGEGIADFLDRSGPDIAGSAWATAVLYVFLMACFSLWMPLARYVGLPCFDSFGRVCFYAAVVAPLGMLSLFAYSLLSDEFTSRKEMASTLALIIGCTAAYYILGYTLMLAGKTF